MKNKIILMAFLGLFVSANIFAKDPSIQNLDKDTLGFKVDCEKTIKESQRAQKNILDYSKVLDEFVDLTQDGSPRICNRANVWVKSVLFDVDYGLKSVDDMYEHCMCLASEVNSDNVEALVKEMQQEYDMFASQKADFIKQAKQLQDKVNKFLN